MTKFGNPLAAMRLRFVEDIHLVDRIEDWSEVRSPGRARRRRKRGYPQRIIVREVPKPDVYSTSAGIFIGHPETIREFKRQLEEQTRRLP